MGKQSDWNSRKMRRQIRSHDRQFARQHGSNYGKPPKRGCFLFSLVLVCVPALLVRKARRR